MSDDKIEESAEYDNFIGKKVDATPVSLDDFGIEVSGVDPQSASAHWVGMPEFENDNNRPYKSMLVHFRTKENFDDFNARIDQLSSEKTKSIWHPKNDATKNSLMRWMEDEE